ncbi:GATS protein-like 3 [Podila minutissima]|uniref:GATS protein-like 3 n=1 Tax=Podila minutissima TaxID=64525 RepID=A0A9P5SEV3_9FUNG|nr:GATS protein-like 3 [Podila minutissima]
MIIVILPFRLQLASLQKEDIPRCTHQLMKLVLFPAGPRHFFSYTETEKEVSLILDESHLSGFPENTLNICNVVWRAVQIEAGESGLGADEIVSQVSRPLAEINVSILQISTYDADFTLLPECDLERSLECLSKTFKISNNPLGDAGLKAGDLGSWESTYPTTPGGINSLQEALLHTSTYTSRGRQFSIKSDQPEGDFDQSDSGVASEVHSESNSGHGSHVTDDGFEASLIASLSLKDDVDDSTSSVTQTELMHPFKANFTHKLRITSMEPSLMDQLAVRLLESIFFDTRTDRFFSYTQTDNTRSIIMDEETLLRFPDNSLNTQAGSWRLIAIGDGPLGFDECGIVSEFSRPLSEHGIQLFYLSTFHSDYIMVNDQDFEDAVMYLQQTAKSPKVEEMVRKRASISSVNSSSSTTQPEQEDGQEEEEKDSSWFQEPMEVVVPV